MTNDSWALLTGAAVIQEYFHELESFIQYCRGTRMVTRLGTATSDKNGPSLAATAWEGPDHGPKHGAPIPYCPAPAPVRTGTRHSEDFRETPRLVVDSLKGNVFVNQYLIIKELGRGAHGSVKLVFDTEQQVVHAMKVIHRKGTTGVGRRRNSLNLENLVAATAAAAAGTAAGPDSQHGLHAVAGGPLMRGHSLSADSSQLGCAGMAAVAAAGLSRSTSVSPYPMCSSPVRGAASFTAALPVAAVGAAAVGLVGAVPVDPLTANTTAGSVGGQAVQQLQLQLQSDSQSQLVLPQQQQQQHAAEASTGASLSGAATGPGQTQAWGPDCLGGATTANVQDEPSQPQQAFAAASLSLGVSRASSHSTPLPSLRTAGSSSFVPAVAAAAAAAALLTTGSESNAVAASAVQPLPPLSPHATATAAAVTTARSSPLPWQRPQAAAVLATASGNGERPVLAPMPIAAAVDATTSELAREIAVMKRLNHPNVVKLFEVIHDQEQKLLLMVMEYMPGGPILSKSKEPGLTMEPLPEPAARTYFRELISAVDYLHSNLIMHGDLKPDNLLLSADGRLKISDFGSATVLPHEHTLMSTTMGTPAFMAPEMCGPKATLFAPSPAEVWSVGVCLYMLAFGRVPFVSSSTAGLYEAIRAPEPVQLPEQPAISPQLRSLLAGLLDKDPSTRTKLHEVLSHDWVMDCGRLPPVQHYRESGSQPGNEPDTVQQKQVLTALKKQVKTAVPNVEERTYKKGSLLVQQGQVPEGLFLILSGTCELVLLSHLLELQAQPGSTAGRSTRTSLTSKVVSAVQPSGRDSPGPGLLRAQSSSPAFALPPKRDADIDFAAQLSDSDETSDSDAGSEQQQQQQQQQGDQDASEWDPVRPGFPFFRLTASADGARRLPPGGMMGSPAGLGRPWSPSVGTPSPPPIIEGVPSAPCTYDSPVEGDGVYTLQGCLGQHMSEDATGVEEAASAPLPSFSADGGHRGLIPGTIPSLSGTGLPPALAAMQPAALAGLERPLPAPAATAPASSSAAGVFVSASVSEMGAAPLQGAALLSADGSASGTPQSVSLDGGPARSQPGGRKLGHVKSCSVDFSMLEQPKPLQPQRSGGNLQQLKAAAAAATSGVLASGLQCLQAFQGFKPLGRALVGSPTQSGSASPAALTYQSLCQASAPDLCSHLRRAQGRGDSLLDVLFPANGGGSGTASPGGLVQRSASSAVVGGRVYHRAMRRSESMHRRMVDLVAAAKMRTQTNSKRQELVGIRGPGQIVGDTNLNGKPAPAAATVRARSRMRVLLVRPSDAAALVTQPTIKAALYRTQTEASVLDALETFAAYDDEVAVIDELRRSRTASFAAATRGALVSAGSGIPALGSAHGSGQWLATASSGGSSMLESYGSVASSLVSYVSAASLAPMAEGLPGAGVASAVAAAGRSNPLPVALPLSQPGGSFTSPVRVPSKPELTAGPGSAGGSPLRPGSRGNSFTAGSAAARQQAATPSGLRGTSSRLGLRIQGGQQQPQPQPQPGVNISPLPSPHA